VSDRVRFRVIPTEDGLALKTLLGRRLQRPQADATSLIRAGGVYVNELRIRVPGVRVAKGERITVYPGADRVDRLPPEALRFVHRAPGFCVIDKPHGVPAEPTRASCLGTLTDALVRLLEREGVLRPYVGVVHALEPRAAGLVMLSTRGSSDTNQRGKLAAHPVRRTYLLETRAGPSPIPSWVPVTSTDGRRLLRADVLEESSRELLARARAAGHTLVGAAAPDAPLHLWCARMQLVDPFTGAGLDLRAAAPEWAVVPD
jgi:hypothetical protein